jgi:L,D-peptidoglycan transpeptidase YkuD (ErfK/YbiS/YcfS/YnhG family)
VRLNRFAPTAAAVILTVAAAACSTGAGGTAGHTGSPTTSSTSAAPPPSSSAPASSPVPTSTPAAPSSRPARATSSKTAPHRTPSAAPRSTPRAATPAALPLSMSTAGARQVLTVTAPSMSSTTGRLQAWRKVSGGWRRVGPSVAAHLGSDGMSRHASESTSATPIGSFTLTQAFGHDPDPGTALPYTRTTPDDWWVSQAGPLYNTRQRCASHCGFTRGDPNEHLYYETPYYDHAVVIDYNTRNAPGGVRAGRGSAFFLHVTDGGPTAGCVSIAASQLVRIMRWLAPSAHPRIVIGAI